MELIPTELAEIQERQWHELEAIARDAIDNLAKAGKLITRMRAALVIFRQDGLPAVEYMAEAPDADPEDHERLERVRAVLAALEEQS